MKYFVFLPPVCHMSCIFLKVAVIVHPPGGAPRDEMQDAELASLREYIEQREVGFVPLSLPLVHRTDMPGGVLLGDQRRMTIVWGNWKPHCTEYLCDATQSERNRDSNTEGTF